MVRTIFVEGNPPIPPAALCLDRSRGSRLAPDTTAGPIAQLDHLRDPPELVVFLGRPDQPAVPSNPAPPTSPDGHANLFGLLRQPGNRLRGRRNKAAAIRSGN